MVIKPLMLVLLGSSQIHAVLSPVSIKDSNFNRCKEIVWRKNQL